jgi:hypothetical protein
MDTNLVLRSGATDLTGDESLTAVHLGPMVKPMELMVLVPSITGGADTLDVEVEFNDDGSTQISNMNFKQITAAGLYHEPIFTHHDYALVKLNITDVGGSGFSAGAVKVWLAPVGRYDSDYNA